MQFVQKVAWVADKVMVGFTVPGSNTLVNFFEMKRSAEAMVAHLEKQGHVVEKVSSGIEPATFLPDRYATIAGCSVPYMFTERPNGAPLPPMPPAPNPPPSTPPVNKQLLPTQPYPPSPAPTLPKPNLAAGAFARLIRDNLESEEITPNYYNYTYQGVKIDPYRIIDLYGIKHPAHQHALKKLLRIGQSIKDQNTDIQEVINSLKRWQEMIKEDGNACE